ncbi:hypothetical protein C8R46DRAFT_1081938, partial [Mycena filopes]
MAPWQIPITSSTPPPQTYLHSCGFLLCLFWLFRAFLGQLLCEGPRGRCVQNMQTKLLNFTLLGNAFKLLDIYLDVAGLASLLGSL